MKNHTPQMPATRALIREGVRNLTLEQTRVIRREVQGIEPTGETAMQETWAFDVTLDGGGEGEVIITLPRDHARPGTLAWHPARGEAWVDHAYSQLADGEHMPAIEEKKDRTGGKAKAAALLAQLAARQRGVLA